MKLLMCLFVLVVLANSSTLDTYYNPKWRKTRGMNEANSSQVTSIYILYEVNVYEMETNGYHYIYIYIYIKREIWHIILWFIIVFYIKEKLLNLVMINIQFNYYQLLYHYCNGLINYINMWSCIEWFGERVHTSYHFKIWFLWEGPYSTRSMSFQDMVSSSY